MFSTLGQADNSEIWPVLKVNQPQSKNLGIKCVLLSFCDAQFLYQRNVANVQTDSQTEFQNFLVLILLLNNLIPNQAKVTIPFVQDEIPGLIK